MERMLKSSCPTYGIDNYRRTNIYRNIPDEIQSYGLFKVVALLLNANERNIDVNSHQPGQTTKVATHNLIARVVFRSLLLGSSPSYTSFLLAQDLTLQSWLSTLGPRLLQSCPPFDGGGLEHLRMRRLTPPAHVLLHNAHWDH